MIRVAVEPELLRWARERAGHGIESLRGRFPKLELWERGEAQPTLKQLEAFARATYVPVGYLFLHEPPVEDMPIPDLRTLESRKIGAPSPDLLDTLYLCQRRQGLVPRLRAVRRRRAARLRRVGADREPG